MSEPRHFGDERQESLRAKMMALIVASVESEADAGSSALNDFMVDLPQGPGGGAGSKFLGLWPQQNR